MGIKKIKETRAPASENDSKEFTAFCRISLFKGLQEDAIRRVFAAAERVLVKRGQVIMREGEAGNEMFVFVSGTVEVHSRLTLSIDGVDVDSVDKSIVRLKAVDVGFVGEMALIEDAPRSATVQASEPCILYSIDKQRFNSLCMKHPDIGYVIMRNMAGVFCSRIRKSNTDILKLTTALSLVLS